MPLTLKGLYATLSAYYRQNRGISKVCLLGCEVGGGMGVGCARTRERVQKNPNSVGFFSGWRKLAM